MAASYALKAGDTGPTNTTTLLDRDGVAANLVGATVRFHMQSAAGAVVVDADATVVDAAAGTVCYVRTAGDGTHTAGRYLGEYEVTFAGGDVQTFPEGETFITVTIRNDIA